MGFLGSFRGGELGWDGLKRRIFDSPTRPTKVELTSTQSYFRLKSVEHSLYHVTGHSINNEAPQCLSRNKDSSVEIKNNA